MINMFKDFIETRVSVPLNECGDGECTHMDITDVLSKIKELAININSDAANIIPKIVPTQTYSGNIHSTTNAVTSDNLEDITKNDPNGMTFTSMSGETIILVLNKIPKKLMSISDLLFTRNTENSCNMKELIDMAYKAIAVYSRAAIELTALVNGEISNNGKTTLTESSEENVESYVNELEKIVKDIREYYDKSDYAKLLTPRKKPIDKMKEYVKGALDRKYTLKVPLYKIENANKETRDIIENRFIKDIQAIVAKGNNYAVLSPSWDEDEDIFIYLTLKEPFGEEGDSKERKEDSKEDRVDKEIDPSTDTNDNKKETNESAELNEAAGNGKPAKLSKEERDALDDKEFGLPSLRRYPLNDEAHIKEAINMFHFCKPEFKKELAKNIARRVKELHLVGKVLVPEKNRFKDYFPAWMLENSMENVDKAVNESVDIEHDDNISADAVFVNGKLI